MFIFCFIRFCREATKVGEVYLGHFLTKVWNLKHFTYSFWNFHSRIFFTFIVGRRNILLDDVLLLLLFFAHVWLVWMFLYYLFQFLSALVANKGTILYTVRLIHRSKWTKNILLSWRNTLKTRFTTKLRNSQAPASWKQWVQVQPKK